ncbi:MAG: DUF4834 family protein [Prevotellaceae bacterium]|jgi:hypothetical protein|nr:DUF4834 family protein [Prevotellaceae bacterium]
MGFLGFLAVIFITFMLLGVSLIGSFLRALFGGGRRTTTSTTDRNADDRVKYSQSKTPHREKFFSKDEGEYVEFEEV